MLDLQSICRYTSEDSPLPTVATEGGTHKILYANPSFCKLLGKTKEDLVGHPFVEVVPEESENGCIALFDRVYRTGTTERLAEQRHSPSPHTPVYWSYSVWAVHNGEKKPAGVMIQINDATETALFRRQVTAMNQKLLVSSVQQHELAQKAEEASVRFQGAMQETHHRVKNNLQVVATLAEIQIREDIGTVPVSAMERIVAHTHALADLHDLLTQQVKGNEVIGGQETLDVEISLSRLMPLLQASIGTQHIHFEFASLRLSINKSASLSLLVSELVSNAHKHGAGEITITLTQEGEMATLAVGDTGPGFPPDFDPQVAANNGLDIISTLAEHSLRGTIEFTNKLTGGACILVVFPL